MQELCQAPLGDKQAGVSDIDSFFTRKLADILNWDHIRDDSRISLEEIFFLSHIAIGLRISERQPLLRDGREINVGY